MKRFKMLLLAVAGVILPVALVFSAYLIAKGSIGVAGTVPPVPQNRVTDQRTPSPTSTQSDEPTGKGGVVDDRGGRCSEQEHANDLECKSGTGSGGSGGSGSGSGSDDSNSGPGGSGSGDDSSHSGPGAGSDD